MRTVLVTVLAIAFILLESTQGSPVPVPKPATAPVPTTATTKTKRQTEGAADSVTSALGDVKAAATSSAAASAAAQVGQKLQNFSPVHELPASVLNMGSSIGAPPGSAPGIGAGNLNHDAHPPPKMPTPEEPEKTAISAVTSFLPMVPMVMESVSGSLGHIFLESLPQAPVFTNLNNMAQVLVSPLSSVTTGMIGNPLTSMDEIFPGIHSLKPITDTFPGFTNLFNQAVTHPHSFVINPDTLSVPQLGTNGYASGGGGGYSGMGGGQSNLIPVAIPSPNGKGQSIVWVSPSGPGGGGYGSGGYENRYPFHMPTSDINVEQIMGQGIQRILGIGAFMGNCPMGTIRLTTGGCQSIMNAG